VLMLVPFLLYLLSAPLSGGRAELLPEGLKIHYPFYGRTIPYPDIKAEGLGQVDYNATPEKAAKWRTNGIGLPGYVSGWFRLRSGGKALLFVADQKNVVEIPTTLGFVVHMSVSQPGEFLTASGNRL
jgi:hypothetical protein